MEQRRIFDDDNDRERFVERLGSHAERGRDLEVSLIIARVGRELGLNPGWERQQRHDIARPILAAVLCKYGGLSQRQVAPLLGLRTGAAVSLQLKRLESVLGAGKAEARLMERIEQELTLLRSRANAII